MSSAIDRDSGYQAQGGMFEAFSSASLPEDIVSVVMGLHPRASRRPV